MNNIVNDALVHRVLYSEIEYFYDKLIRDKYGNEYYMPPKDTELTFRFIDNEIVPFVGRESNISPRLVVELMDLFKRDFLRRFYILNMPESDIVKYLGRPLNDKEIIAKRTVDDMFNDHINDIFRTGKIPSNNSDYMSNVVSPARHIL